MLGSGPELRLHIDATGQGVGMKLAQAYLYGMMTHVPRGVGTKDLETQGKRIINSAWRLRVACGRGKCPGGPWFACFTVCFQAQCHRALQRENVLVSFAHAHLPPIPPNKNKVAPLLMTGEVFFSSFLCSWDPSKHSDTHNPVPH